MTIVGVDPGLRATGYGVIDHDRNQLQFVTAGDIRPPTKHLLASRLKFLHDALSQIISRYHPTTMVLEMVFTHQSYVATAAKSQVARMLGQWLGRDDTALSSDATDALALAIAHVHMDSHRAVAGAA